MQAYLIDLNDLMDDLDQDDMQTLASGISKDCKSFFDGCNSCSRREPGGPAMCTRKACSPAMMKPAVCYSYFPKESLVMKLLNKTVFNSLKATGKPV